MKLKVYLSIGYVVGNHEDVIEVDDDDYNACETDDQRDKLLGEYWQDWANNYIEGGFKIVEGE